MLDTLQTIGATFYPLRDADDAACLMEAAARAPAATPRRAERIVEFLASSLQMVTATSCQVMQFFSKVHGHGRFDAVVSSIPDSDGQIIVTDRTCIVCGEALEEAVNDRGKSFGASPSLFTQDGVVHSTLIWLRCSRCKAHHYYSYAVGGDRLPPGTAQIYPDWFDAKYTHVTEHSVFETRTLKRYRQQCLHSHTGVLSSLRCCDECDGNVL